MIRTIITPDTKTVSFEVPENYLGKKIEVIAFAVDEGIQHVSKKTMADFWGVISKERAAKWIDEVNQSKDEWEKDI
jgi:hypothetical protein